MRNTSFYDIVDSRIDELIEEFKDDSFLIKQDSNGKKSYAFLLWFLEQYVPNEKLYELSEYITEGKDDHSCDLIFSNQDNAGNEVFYVVQVKWFEKQKISSTNKITKEIKACLTDFRLIRSGKKKPSGDNKMFATRYKEFLKHKNKNGKVTFMFVALCVGPTADKIDALTKEFSSTLASFKLIDINKLKKDYVELVHKGIRTHNPIEIPYIPSGKINLEIEASNSMEVRKQLPYGANIFFVRPSLIFKLFEKYGYALFYKNIRNPLPRSLYNEQMSKTINNNPSNFWYFNNGITAITDEISEFYRDSDNVDVEGLQIINGAQTVFSIFSAYNTAGEKERRLMDKKALITFRVLTSGGTDFDLEVTRYTNAQNPISERDFHANDDVQGRIKDDFLFNTDVWYESRRGEYIKQDRGIAKVISNEILAQTYLAYHMEEPVLAKSSVAKFFVSQTQERGGLYEKIFNELTNHEDMLISYYIYAYIYNKKKIYRKKIKAIKPNNRGKYTKSQLKTLEYNFLQHASFHLLSLFKHLMAKINSGSKRGLNGKVITDIEKNDYKKIERYYDFIVECVKEYIVKETQKDKTLVLSVYFKTKDTYNDLKTVLDGKLKKSKTKIKRMVF